MLVVGDVGISFIEDVVGIAGFKPDHQPLLKRLGGCVAVFDWPGRADSRRIIEKPLVMIRASN